MIIALSFGMIGCVKEPEMSVWKVEITSTENIDEASITSSDYSYKDIMMTTTSITKEFPSPEVGSVGVTTFGSGVLTVKIWKDGVVKQKSESDGGLNFSY